MLQLARAAASALVSAAPVAAVAASSSSAQHLMLRSRLLHTAAARRLALWGTNASKADAPAEADVVAADASADAAADDVAAVDPASCAPGRERRAALARARALEREAASADVLLPQIPAPTGPRLLQRQRARLHWAGDAGVGLAKAPKPLFDCPAARAKGQIMKRSYRGIFAGVHVMTGNYRSHSERKSENNKHKQNNTTSSRRVTEQRCCVRYAASSAAPPAHCFSCSSFFVCFVALSFFYCCAMLLGLVASGFRTCT
jgi:hypothetical protein